MPDWKPDIRARLSTLNLDAVRESEIVEEISQHLDDRFAELHNGGASEAEARRLVLAELIGGKILETELPRVERLGHPGQAVLGQTKGNMLEEFFADWKYGGRMLRKNPGFAFVAVLTLALGIGANTTIFSIINSMLIKPVPVNHPEQIVGVYQHDLDDPRAFNYFSYPDFVDLRAAQSVAFTDLFAFRFATVGIQGDLTEKVAAEFVSANYLTALGVPPARGRVFISEEEASGAPVAVLTDHYWRKLGADISIIGKKLKLTRGDVTVIGVMPKGFSGAQVLAPEIFLPIGLAPILNPNPSGLPSRILTDRADRGLVIMGRLKPGVTLANVSGALAGLNQQFVIPDPGDPKPRTLICAPPSRFNFSSQPSRSIDGLAKLAALAFALSILVLIIACLNLANMMIARGAARQKEVAIRLAVGAGRRRILRQLLTEGLVLPLLGGAAGLVVSMWATSLLSAFLYSGTGMPPDFPKFDLSPDRRVLAVLLLASGAATLVFALAPAWKLARLDFNADLKRNAGEDARTGRPGWLRGRELLAVGQIGFTLALLVVATLFARSAINTIDANPGFEFGSNFYLSIDTTLAAYPESRVRKLIREAAERLPALPGVECASPAMSIPFGNANWRRDIQIGGAPPPSDSAATFADGKALQATYNVVGANYFRTLGIPLFRGREFEPREMEVSNAERVAIISQRVADRMWPGEDAIGRSIQFPGSNPKEAPTVMTVVGIAAPIQWRLFDDGPSAEIYVPFGQAFESYLNFHVRVAPGANPKDVMAEARNELRNFDPQIPITNIKTMAAMHRDGPSVRVARLGALLFGAFGGLGVFLSLLGIYGLKAYAVARRAREIGIRMALGANRRDVTSMILRESLWLALPGMAFGISLAVAVANLSSPYLYRVRPLDPATFGALPPALLVVVLGACWVPARRAARVDPLVALRSE